MIKLFKPQHRILFGTLLISLAMNGCKDLTELNIDPNGVSEQVANPNMLLPTVLSSTATKYNEVGFIDLGGMMQYTQMDAWFASHNDYEWSGGILSWDGYYAILRDNELMIRRSKEEGLEFNEGVGLVMRAFVFGLIADMWGDAPYTDAAKGDLAGGMYKFPKFDSQEVIYKGIIAELAQANDLLSKDDASYGVLADADLYFKGKASGWRRFANALALRYYMRLSEKDASFARAGIENILANSTKYPIITRVEDEVSMPFVGNNTGDSWPSNTVYDASGSNFRRMKMCATFVEKLQGLADPRLAVWANKVTTPIRIQEDAPEKTDRIVNNVRIVSPDVVRNIVVDTDVEYVGLPPSVSKDPSTYNLNPTPGQTSQNPHVSYLNDIYRAAKGDLLKARLLSAAEVSFILSEAALKNWNVGESSRFYYERGIQQSLQTWTKGNMFEAYIAQPGVIFAGTQEQIIQQKWIASWSMAVQSWSDYRRTGFPKLVSGPAAVRPVIPVRIPYNQTEMTSNRAQIEQALGRMEKTAYSQAENENSAWSKPWLLQGTNKPW